MSEAARMECSAAALLRLGVERLAAAKIPQARRETAQLLAALMNRPVADLLINGDTLDSGDIVATFEKSLDRRISGEPLPYIVGTVGFRYLELQVDHRVLIPRPETEGLVELALRLAGSGIAADIGTGSGCLALSLLAEGGFSKVVAVDLSRDALEVARANAERLQLPLSLVHSDLCQGLRDDRFNLIVSNPPYISSQEYAALDSSVRDWEPITALCSGDDGLDATRRLLVEARRVLIENGWLLIECDAVRAAATAGIAESLGWLQTTIHHDLFGRPRYLATCRGNAS